MRVLIKPKGFTLLELMLVLVLLTTLTIGSLSMYQIQLRNFRVDKTALQMQQWLQASLAFYVDCHQWPDPAVDPDIMNKMMGGSALTSQVCQNPNYVGTVRNYMPAGSDQNGPWLNRYEIVPGSSQNDAPSLVLRTNIGPYSYALFNSGKMIAARLPFGNVFAAGSDVIVRASVVKPASAIVDKSRGFILNMQTVPSAQISKIKKPTADNCPTGMVPDVELAPVTFSPPETNAVNGVVTTPGFANGFVVPQVSVASHVTPIWPWDPPYEAYNTTGQVLVITACLPANSSMQPKLNNESNVSTISRY